MILIFGAGNIGSLIGGLLEKSGQKTVLIGNADHIKAIREKGLQIIGLLEACVFPKASTTVNKITEKIDFAFVTVKAYDTGKAAWELKKILGTETTIVSLQNGMGTENILKKAFPCNIILRGITSMGAFRPQAGIVNWSGMGETLIGYGSQKEKDRAVKFKNLLPEIPVKLEPNILGAIFTKVIVNCALNPIAAVHGVKNIEIYRNPDLRKIAENLAQEAWNVAKKMDVQLTTENPIELALEIAFRTGNNINSMLYDVRNHRKTEIDFLNGKIIRLGKNFGVDVSLNYRYYQKVKMMEEEYLR